MNKVVVTNDCNVERDNVQSAQAVNVSEEMVKVINDTFTKVEPIHKGWSKDKKFYAETNAGEKLLIRVSNISDYEDKKHEFELMTRISQTVINMSKPIDFGICNNGKNVYQVLAWCEGDEAKELLPSLTEEEQYLYGCKTAEIIRSMETINQKPISKEWEQCYKQRVERYIELYHNCGYSFDGDEVILSYLKENSGCIGNRPMSLMHEDLQTDNMVISPDGKLYIIDFQTCGMVDPYYAMMSVGVSAMYSVPFARGQIEGYFGKNVPSDFWEKYTYYMLAEMLYAYTVAVTVEEERAGAQSMFTNQIESIKNRASFVPDWYRG